MFQIPAKCITWILPFKLHNNYIGEVLLSFTFRGKTPSLEKLCKLIELSPVRGSSGLEYIYLTKIHALLFSLFMILIILIIYLFVYLFITN